MSELTLAGSGGGRKEVCRMDSLCGIILVNRDPATSKCQPYLFI